MEECLIAVGLSEMETASHHLLRVIWVLYQVNRPALGSLSLEVGMRPRLMVLCLGLVMGDLCHSCDCDKM